MTLPQGSPRETETHALKATMKSMREAEVTGIKAGEMEALENPVLVSLSSNNQALNMGNIPNGCLYST